MTCFSHRKPQESLWRREVSQIVTGEWDAFDERWRTIPSRTSRHFPKSRNPRNFGYAVFCDIVRSLRSVLCLGEMHDIHESPSHDFTRCTGFSGGRNNYVGCVGCRVVFGKVIREQVVASHASSIFFFLYYFLWITLHTLHTLHNHRGMTELWRCRVGFHAYICLHNFCDLFLDHHNDKHTPHEYHGICRDLPQKTDRTPTEETLSWWDILHKTYWKSIGLVRY